MSALPLAPELAEPIAVAELTYDQRRNRRPPGLKRRLLRIDGKAPLLPTGYWPPRTRGDCIDDPRPCGFVACRHHLAFDITARGAIVENFPERELEDLPTTCSLDVADGVGEIRALRDPTTGGISCEVAGEFLNVSRERVRQIEEDALKSVRKALLEIGGAP